MRKPYVIIAAALASVSLATTALGAVSLTIDGRPIELDVPPAIIEGRTLVPVRAIFEDLGANVNWDGDTKTVSAYSRNTSIKLKINDTTAYVNGQALTLDVPAQIIDGRTLVPARFVAESLNCRVDWDNDTKTVSILTSSFPSDIYVDPEDDMIAVANHLVSDLSISFGNLKARYGDDLGIAMGYHGEYYVKAPDESSITYVISTDFMEDYELKDDSPVIRIEGKLSDMVDGLSGNISIDKFMEKLDNGGYTAYYTEREGQTTSYYISENYYEVYFSRNAGDAGVDYDFEQSLHIDKEAGGEITPDTYAWLVKLR